MKRRIRKATIKYISLVPAGANGLAPIYKADADGGFSVGTLMKMDDQGELLAVVYPAEVRDSQGDIASADVVKQMAYDFFANKGAIDIMHDGKAVPADKARIGESFIVQKSDTRFHGWTDYRGQAVDLTSAWATVIKIDDPDLRALYKSGQWRGVSMGGTALVEQEKSDMSELSSLVKEVLNKLNPQKPKEDEMDSAALTTITKAITDGFGQLTASLPAAVAKAVVDAVKPADKPADKPAEKNTAPVFKGSMDDPRALEAHARLVELHALKSNVDWADPASIRAYQVEVATRKAEWAAADKEAGVEEPAPKGKKTPGAPAGEPEETVKDVSKMTVAEQRAYGAELADRHNPRKKAAAAGNGGK